MDKLNEQASEHLPSYLPTLILSNERLLPLGLHPIPHNPDMLRSLAAKRNTALFYKQSKYNLLRESSEGFSRLIVLLLGSDALPPTYITQQESDEDRAERARGVWSKIMGLIGYFSLSPPRVLDLVLEIASCNVAEHWQFWLELLRCSPWGATAKSSKGKERMWDESVQGIERALDGQGDRVLAQVLGVKFSFCQASR
jgi:THO complex subunit 2